MPTEEWERKNRALILKNYTVIAKSGMSCVAMDANCVFMGCMAELDASNMVIVDYIAYNRGFTVRNLLCYDCWCRVRNNMITNYPELLGHIIRVIGPRKEVLYSRVVLPEDIWERDWDEPELVPIPNVDPIHEEPKMRVRGARLTAPIPRVVPQSQKVLRVRGGRIS